MAYELVINKLWQELDDAEGAFNNPWGLALQEIYAAGFDRGDYNKKVFQILARYVRELHGIKAEEPQESNSQITKEEWEAPRTISRESEDAEVFDKQVFNYAKCEWEYMPEVRDAVSRLAGLIKYGAMELEDEARRLNEFECTHTLPIQRAGTMPPPITLGDLIDSLTNKQITANEIQLADIRIESEVDVTRIKYIVNIGFEVSNALDEYMYVTPPEFTYPSARGRDIITALVNWIGEKRVGNLLVKGYSVSTKPQSIAIDYARMKAEYENEGYF